MPSVETTEARRAEAERFVGDFARVWARPVPEQFGELFRHDIRLKAPLRPGTRGRDQAVKALRRLFEQIPDLTARVYRWGATEDGVLIEFTLSGTIGGRPVAWDAVDRFILDGGLAAERISYFDPLPILRATVTRPRAWPVLFRAVSR